MTVIEELLSKYIKNTDQIFYEIKTSNEAVNVDIEKIRIVIDKAKRYFEDAKYYRDRKKFETALVSIAYAEGLLDSLRLLGTIELKWPTNMLKEGGT